MKTSSINYRVADFLRQHPPFQFVEEERLLQLAENGRVKFHQSDEEIFQMGTTRRPFVYVIQQGSVELLDHNGHGEQLRDILGEGDFLGAGCVLGLVTHVHTARTKSDVLVYALPAAEFVALAENNAPVSRYLDAYFSANPAYSTARADAAKRAGRETKQGAWFETGTVPDDFAAARLVRCESGSSIAHAARIMARRRRGFLVVTGTDGAPAGFVTSADLRDRVATGEVSPESPVSEIMRPDLPLAALGAPAGDYTLAMLRARCPAVGLTSPDAPGKLHGLVSGEDLQILFGSNPALLAARILEAESIAELARLRPRVDALISENLTGPSAIDWLLHAASEIHSALIDRVIALTQGELAASGKFAPAGEFAWLLFGAAGRRALLAFAELECGLIYDDPKPGAESAAEAYYNELSRAVAVQLVKCGFLIKEETSPLGSPQRCRPLSAWKESYTGWIEQPILNRIYQARSYFDFLTASGSKRFAAELAEHILNEVRANEGFLPLLANDSMANLPPLTFFRGFVVDESNIQKDSLDIGRSVLSPLIDVGRVFALGATALVGASTLDRFAGAASGYPAYAQTFVGAAEALRIGLYQQAVFGLKEGGSRTIIRPPELSKYDQQLLKSAFRSILNLIETAARHHGIRPR